jgi:imidazole glycerol phosphate synthase glutamine amidotransferase subunit
MDPHTVAVVRTGVANLASVLAGLRRAGAGAVAVDDARDIADARRVVLPGVGSFAVAITQLRTLELVEPLTRRIHEGRPTLAICLGMQLLGSGSDEAPAEKGLGIWPQRAERFDAPVRVPQLGWNVVTPDPECDLVQCGYAYFANSYRFVEAPVGWNRACSDHGGRFVAALERGGVLACQFHPELSGTWGTALLRRWLAHGPAEAPTC